MHSPRDPVSIQSTTDFARYVGLARTTVSRVLNGHPGVKRSTIEKVQRALEETGFTPNAFAVGLRGKGAAVAGICMENLLTPPMVAKLARLQSRLRDRGYTCLIEVLAPGDSRRVVQHFQAMRAGAVFFIGQFVASELAERVAELRRRGIAHVLIDQAGVPGANTVSFDRATAMRQVMDHLLDHGHRSFGLLGMSGTVQSVRDRLRGVHDALIARRLAPEECTRSLDHLCTRDNDFAYGRALARAFTRLEQPPTALVALNDEVAIGAMLELEDLGHAIPNDFSVAGFNNQDICMMTAPNVTSVDQQIDATIDIAMRLLDEQLARPTEQPRVRMVEPTLVVRQSTGPARARARPARPRKA